MQKAKRFKLDTNAMTSSRSGIDIISNTSVYDRNARKNNLDANPKSFVETYDDISNNMTVISK